MTIIATARATSTAHPSAFFARWADTATWPEWNTDTEWVRLDGPFVLFDVRDIYEDDHLLALVLQQIAGWVWGQTARVADRRPRLLAIDEAHRLVGHPAGGELLARLARRARKRYLAVLTLSQHADDFIGTAFCRTATARTTLP